MEQEDINNSDIRLIFKDFGYYPYNKSKGEYEDFVSLIKGNWTLNFISFHRFIYIIDQNIVLRHHYFDFIIYCNAFNIFMI